MDRKFPLQRRYHSRHDYVHPRALGATPLPQNLLFTSTVLDQGSSEECTAYAACAIRESQKGKQYQPDKFWDMELAMLGDSSATGADLDTQGAVARKIGFVPVTGDQKYIDQISAYVYVYRNSGFDWFDSIRHTINDIQAPLSSGIDWYSEWNNAPNGIIPHSQTLLLGGHCIKIAGFENRNGIDYLTLQNSWGPNEGVGGFFYVDRYMANKIFTYGITYFSDDGSVAYQRMGLLVALLVNVRNLCRILLQRLGL